MKLFIKRFSLVIIGIFLSLIIIECGLRLAGWTIVSYQQYKNKKAVKNKSQYTIMCLGESTTQNQYPIKLQKILNKKYPNKFSVIDCGIPGTNLAIILNSLDKNINKYIPSITICMMGINDQFGQKSNTNKKSGILNLKLVNLIVYICDKPKKQIPIVYDTRELLQNINFFSDKLKKAVNLFYQGNKNEAKMIFQALLKQNPGDEIVYYFLSIIDNNLQNYINAINWNFSFMRFEYYGRIILYYKIFNDMEKAKYFAELACNDKNPMSVNIDLYGTIKNIISEENKIKIKKKLLNPYMEESNMNDVDYGLLSYEYLEQKDFQKAQEYFNKANEIRLKFPDLEIYKSYKLIIKKLTDNNIKVICMQYPVRSILPLQEQLKNEPFFDKITFVSNEKNFKDMLMQKNFDDLFIDQFAGDFGHCTDLGNTLIAENVVNTLENILNLKEN